MTRHRKREEWIADILAAAAEVIDRSGYPNLTMEAIAASTGLSKGGVYRFFKNKRDVALALFSKLYLQLLDFDLDAVLQWNASIEETIFRLLFSQFDAERSDERTGRIWVQLLPETTWSEDFRQEARRLQEVLTDKYRRLVRRLIERDRISVPADFEGRLQVAFDLGTAIMQGLVIQGTTGAPRAVRARLLRQFIAVMMDEMFSPNKMPTTGKWSAGNV